MNQMVPSGGDMMYVRRASPTRITYTPSCMFCTNLSGGKNFIFGTIGPPIRLSMKEGISNSGIASFGISEPMPA